jgi:thiol-disulfide isomerase/thioredoxin
MGGSSGVLVGKKAPDVAPSSWVQGKLEAGQTRGKVVILDFWATWCVPCRETLPTLRRMWKKNARRGVLVVGIHEAKGDAASILRLARQERVTYPLAIDSASPEGGMFGDTFTRYRVESIPYTFVVDRRGVVRWAGHPLLPGFAEAVEKALRER